MTINIKSVGGRVLCLSASVPVQPAAPFTTPVTMRKCRMSAAVKLRAALVRIRARAIVKHQRELREQFAHF